MKPVATFMGRASQHFAMKGDTKKVVAAICILKGLIMATCPRGCSYFIPTQETGQRWASTCMKVLFMPVAQMDW